MADGLSIINPRPTRIPGPAFLHDLVREQAPNGNAAIEHTFEDGSCQRLSYTQLHERSIAIAHRLLALRQRSPVPSNDGRFIVPIYMAQGPELYISQLAILKAGGAFCPIALDAPEERVRFIVKDVGASVLLTTPSSRIQLPQLDGVTIEVLDVAMDDHAATPPTTGLSTSQTAYIMYTSGSTGTPKGVIISHSAATQALLAHDRHIPSFSRFLQFANPTFDVSVFEIFFPLFRGATLVSCSRRRLLNDLPSVINALNVDAAELTPSVASSLLHDREAVPKLKVLLTIGEMLKRSVINEFAGDDEIDGILHGMYGPTEAAIHCTLQPNFTKSLPVTTIGVPLDTVSAFIFQLPAENGKGHNFDIVPFGDEGELVVGGHQLADGYLNREEQTRAAFFDHPQYGRLYRTGDRARLATSGSIECLGRVSSGQVKLRGQRIELGEIEHAASQSHGCRSAVAEVINGTLVAFCVRNSTSLSASQVQEVCRRWLPSFMVPAEILILDELPYLASGKLDRRKLVKQFTDPKRAAALPSEPTTAQVSQVAAIIGEALHREVQTDTPLAGVGVDSLSAIRIASKLRTAGFARVDANAILDASTAADLSCSLQAKSSLPDSATSKANTQRPTDPSVLMDIVRKHPLVADQQLAVTEAFNCTPTQSAMLSETARNPEAYCNWILLRIAAINDLQILQSALHALADKHALLRSGFLTSDCGSSGPVLVVWPRLSPWQVGVVHDFDYRFYIASEREALRPCRFQLKREGDHAQVLLQIHHGLYDQWSIDVLKADLACLLSGHSIGRAYAFRDVAASYAVPCDEACPNKALSFWQQHLRDITATAVPNLNGRHKPRGLQRSLWQDLNFDEPLATSKARNLGFSLPSVLQAALAYMLTCYTGASDITFGCVFSGRHLPMEGIETVFGPCLVTLPCRLDMSHARTSLDLLRLVHSRNRDMQRHALTPLPDIKRAAGVAPGVSLFDTLFVWQESTIDGKYSDHVLEEIDSADYHEFNLVVECAPSTSGVAIRVTFQESLLPIEQIQLLLKQISAAACYLISSLDRPVSELSSRLTPELLSLSNPTPSKCAGPQSLTSRFETQVAEHARAPAVAFATTIDAEGVQVESLSYGELNRRANQLAHLLLSKGVAADDLVCICMEKSIQLYVAVLAVVKAGAGYLPILPETPPARVASILHQAKVKMVLCETACYTMLQDGSGAEVLDLDQANVSNYPADNPALPSDSSNVCYTVFTSGSTGEPKGVAVTFGNLGGNLNALSDLYRVAPGDRLLQACSHAFDVSVFEIFFALTTGMCLCAATKQVLFRDLELSIRLLHITHVSLTPTVAALIAPDNVPSVRFLVTAGEGVTELVRNRWAGRGLHQGYGPSETTNICTINMNMSKDDVLGNVGPPLRNTSAFVISTSCTPHLLPAGAMGELAFGGEQIFRGYVGAEALNARHLVVHPIYGRLYRSGDVGRILHDGSLLVTGRLDDQVKIRGNRIELGEINATLLRDSNVQDCATMVLGSCTEDQVLTSFWVPKERALLSDTSDVIGCDTTITAGLFETLEASLPPYMVPSILVPVTRLPTTSQGKLDRRVLHRLLDCLDESARHAFSRAPGEVSDETEWSVQEQEIATSLAAALHIPVTNISRLTSFFALGLNSLSAIAFARALESRLHRRIDIDTVLRHPSAAQLAKAITEFSLSTSQSRFPAPSETFSSEFVTKLRAKHRSRGLTVDSVLPCTPLQEAMLSASLLGRDAAYTNVTVLKIEGRLPAMMRCWKGLIARHSILRTLFIETDLPSQPFAQVVLQHVDRIQISERRNGERIHLPLQTNHESARIRMDAPFHIHVLHCAQESYLILRMHHAIYDGMSMSTLLQEAESLYREQALPSVVPVEPFLANMLSQRTPETMKYWSARFQDYMPRPFPSSSVVQTPVNNVSQSAVPGLALQVEAFGKTHGIAPLSVYQTAWAKVLSSCQASRDICFGNVVSGRTIPVKDVDRLVAPCFNTIPVRVIIGEQQTSLGIMRKLHDSNVEDLKFQLTPLRSIQALSQAPQTHLFDSLLLLQPSVRELDSNIWSLVEERGTMDLPLIMEIVPRDRDVELRLHYLTSHISETLALALSGAFLASLRACLQFPASSMSYFGDFELASVVGRLETPSAVNNSPSEGVDVCEKWSSEEGRVRQVFADLSGTSKLQIHRQTSMYQLGLDSLHAAQVARRLRAVNIDVDAVTVIENLTPAAIAVAVTTPRSTAPDLSSVIDLTAFDQRYRSQITDLLSIKAETIQAIRPCTAVQCGMIAQSLQSHGELYINHCSWQVPDNVLNEDLIVAWREVQRQHQALRSALCPTDDARKPFAMVIMSAATDLEGSFVSSPQSKVAFAEKKASQAILREPSLPAWRLSIVEERDRRIMTVSMHHALYDADSLRLILSDFGRAVGRQALSERPDIDAILTRILRGERDHHDESRAFWKHALEEASFVRFPDLAPAVVRHKTMQSIQRVLALQISTVEQWSKQQGATIQAIGQSVWAKLLAAYTGEPRVVFGTVLSGRSGNAAEATTFPSISTVPVTCDSSKSIEAILSETLDYNASAYRFRFTPLSEIQRSTGQTMQSLFDTMFVYQKRAHVSDTRFDWPLVKETSAVDYTVSLELEAHLDGSMALGLTFDESLVPEEQADLILRQYEALLLRLVYRSNMSGKELDKLQSVVPARCPEIPSNVRLLHEFVEAGAKQHPNRTALEFVFRGNDNSQWTRPWTYRELNQRANQTAQLIRDHKIQSGGIIGVRMDKCAEASFAFIGILKAGCSFLALDPELPAARQKFILEDSGAKLLLVDHAAVLPTPETDVALVKLSEPLLDTYSCHFVSSSDLDAQSTCYCLYTSGTTGTPKGCEITHENAVQAMLAFQRLFVGHWDEHSRWLQFASYWFDVSVLEQFWSWSVGINVVGASRDLVLDDVAAFINEHNITHIDLTPSLARLLHPDDVPTLHRGVFITGGEALKHEIIDAWGPKGVICNGYGPTEATIGVTMNPFIAPDAKPSNIGPPFDNVGAYVLAPGTDQAVLRGALGELCVSGRLVGKGYLNRPDLTAKHFPYLSSLGERIYRTGDLVRLLSDGSFAFVGRQDSQTKLRGQRLELEEVDRVIKGALEGLIDVASLVVKSQPGSKETLVSFIAARRYRKGDTLKVEVGQDAEQIVRDAEGACRSRLPGYMVPTHIVPVAHIPLTVNNKVDTKKLRALFEALSVSDLQSLKGPPNLQAPDNDDERRLCSLLSDMLRLDRQSVTPESNIFALGLSSISAITFANLIRRDGYIGASVALVMQNPTIRRLAHAVRTHSPGTGQSLVKQSQLSLSAFAQRCRGLAAQRLLVTSDDLEAVTPCTPLQQGLILDSLKSSEQQYFNEFRYALQDLDPKRLERAVQRISAAVQMLRARFIQTHDGFIQVILRQCSQLLHIVDLPKGDVKACIVDERRRWLEQNQSDLLHPFKMAVVLSGNIHVLVLFAHHAIYDGISWQMLLDRLAEAYLADGSPDCGPDFTSILPYGPLQSVGNAKIFWLDHLRNYRYVPLPRLQEAKEGRATSATRVLEGGKALRSARKQLGVSHQAVAKACFEVALLQQYPTVGSYGHVISGRSVEFDGADRVIGPLFNTLPQVFSVSQTDDWGSLVGRLHRQGVAALPYQHTPLRDIRRWRGCSPTIPMFDVMFVFQHQTSQGLGEEHGLWNQLEQEPKADFPLAFEVTLLSETTVSVTAVAQASVADEHSLHNLLDHYARAMRVATTTPDRRVTDDFEVLPHAEVEDMNVKIDLTGQLDGIVGFEWSAQAKRIRDAIAQVSGLSNNEVDEHATIFSLGLDSIDAVRLSSRLKKAGLPLPVSKIMQAQTIPRMLDAISQNEHHSRTQSCESKLRVFEQQLSKSLMSTVPDHEIIERILPATPTQEGLLADMLRSEWKDYYNHDVLRLCAQTEVDRLKAAWQAVVDCSPILRTGFVQVNDPDSKATFAQIVYRSTPLEIVTRFIESEAELPSLLEQITAEAVSSFQQRPLLRLTFVHVQDAQYLVLSLAHAQYDGHSLALIHEDVRRAYGKNLQQRPSYDSIVEDAFEAASEEAQSFWTSALSGIHPMSLAHRAHDGLSPPSHHAERTSVIGLDIARDHCRKYGVSMQALAQTCWAVVLAHYTQSLEVLFGVVLACRDSEEAEQVVFPTMNTVPVAGTLHGSRLEMLRHMQNTIEDMRPYQRTPLRTIKASYSSARSKTYLANCDDLFDTLFIYQHRPDSLKTSDDRLYESVGGSSSVEYPVAVEMEAVADKFVMRATCKDIVLDQDDTQALLKHFDKVLCEIVQSPEEPTVSFTDIGVSVCGLPSLSLPKPKGERREQHPLYSPDKVESETTWQYPLIHSIREALARVARAPADAISFTTTIESIGIDSISAIKVAAILRKQSINISTSEIIRARTVGRMAEVAAAKSEAQISQVATHEQSSSEDLVKAAEDQASNVTYAARALGIGEASIEALMPATAGQLYMLSLWMRSNGRLFYPTFRYLLRGGGDMSLTRIHTAWRQLADLHPILRTVFVTVPGQQVPLDMAQVVLRHSSADDAGKESDATQPFVHFQARPRDGDRGKYYELDLKIHHALYDAVILPLLIADLRTLLDGSQPTFATVKSANWPRHTVREHNDPTPEKFWKSHMEHANPFTLPQPAAMGGPARRVEVFSPRLIDASPLKALARGQEVGLQALLFAAWAKVYVDIAVNSSSVPAPEDVVLGVYLANRHHTPDLEQLRAPTLNLVPLLIRSPRHHTLLALAKQVQDSLREISQVQNAGVGLWEVEEWTGVKIDIFVNFLRLPEGDDTAQQKGLDENSASVVITDLNGSGREGYKRVSESNETDDEGRSTCAVARELQGWPVHKAYQHALDLEVSVVNEALDVGLFCPEDMLGLDPAVAAIQELKVLLEKLVG